MSSTTSSDVARGVSGGGTGVSVPDLVSVIVPAHNRPKELREAVESALAQSYRPLEVWIVDDGSTDDTPAVAESLASGHPDLVRSITRLNGGPGAARETGRLAARGEFIQYLDSDDLLLPGKLERQVGALRREPDADVCYGMALDEAPRPGIPPAALRRTGETFESILPSFLVGRWWTTECPIYRRALLDRAGPWLQIRLEEDWEYDCRLGGLGARLAQVKEPVCVHRELAVPRLSRGDVLDASRLEHRAEARIRILDHARRAGIGPGTPEMQHFARQLFALARQCGAAGLTGRSQELLGLARGAWGTSWRSRWEFGAYRALALILGWKRVARLSLVRDRLPLVPTAQKAASRLQSRHQDDPREPAER